MKEYNKLMKILMKDKRFKLIKTSGHKSTVKLVHIISNQFYTIHPGNKAVLPLKRWINKFK